jgi:tetratricopeptide (TPR) repeat protein
MQNHPAYWLPAFLLLILAVRIQPFLRQFNVNIVTERDLHSFYASGSEVKISLVPDADGHVNITPRLSPLPIKPIAFSTAFASSTGNSLSVCYARISGIRSFWSGNYHQSVIQLGLYLSKHPSDSLVHYWIGESFAALNDWQSVVRHWSQAGLSALSIERARLLLINGANPQAREFLTTITQYFPNSSEAWGYLGETYAKESNWDPAISYSQIGLALNPGCETCLYNLGRGKFYRDHNPDAAIPIIRSAIKLYPRAQYLYEGLASIYRICGFPKEAERTIDEFRMVQEANSAKR